MDDRSIIGRVDELIAEERALRDGSGLDDEKQARLRRVEEELDRCWDLLRQRRARREFGENPDQARPRPAAEVENYLQ